MRHLIPLLITLPLITGCNVSLVTHDSGFYFKKKWVAQDNQAPENSKELKLKRINPISIDTGILAEKEKESDIGEAPAIVFKNPKGQSFEKNLGAPKKSSKRNKVGNYKNQVLEFFEGNPLVQSDKNELPNLSHSLYKKSDSDSEGSNGLNVIGWIFIILGLIFVLFINIILGLLISVVGLLFVLVGGD